MSRKWLVMIGLLFFLVGLIAYAPVATFYGWIASKQPTQKVALFGIEGTVTEGRVATVAVHNRPMLQNLHWSLKPLWLLMGQRVFEISGNQDQSSLEARIRLTPGGDTVVTQSTINLSLKSLLTALGQAYVPMDALATLDLERLVLSSGKLSEMQGVMSLRRLSWTLGRDPVGLGDYDIKAETQEEQIVLNLQSVAGPIDAQGQVTLMPDQSYQLQIKLRSKPEADATVRNLVGSLGAPDSQGWTQIRQQGRLGTAG